MTYRVIACAALGLLLCACGDEPRRDDPPPPVEPEPSASELALRALIATPSPAAAEIEATLSAVALGDGLPLRTRDGTFLFVFAADGGPWLVAGDFDGWSGAPMTRNGALWWAELVISAPRGAGYKYRAGSQWVADPWARRFAYDTYGELSLVEAAGAHLERWPGLASHGLVPRTLRVFVPEAAVTRVLVAHDGQNLFDPAAPWGGWQLQASLPAGTLVVGVDNTAERMDEYTHVADDIGWGSPVGGRAAAYADFIDQTVRPHVVARYGDAPRWGLIGSSLGGLVSLIIADRFPGRYAFAASLSGTLGWGSFGPHQETIIERYAAAGRRDTVIYLDSGGSGSCVDTDGDGILDDDPEARDNYCETAQMRDTLAAAGYVFQQDLWHWHEPGAEHNEAAWAARVWRPLDVFAGL